MNVWILVLALFALSGIQRYVVMRFGLRGLRYDRRLSKKAAFQGETVELIETLRNPRPLFIPWLRVESRISPFLRFGRQENLDITGDQFHKSVFTLMPFQQVRRRHQVRLLRRGEYDVGTVALTVGDLVSESTAFQDMRFDARITVYPALLSREEMPDFLPMARNQGDMIVPRQHQADPFLVCGIRPYQAGDAPRDIHWSATARTGQMQVKVHDYTADTKLLVILNGQIRPDQWGDLMDYEQDVIEYGISLAATLMLHVLHSGAAAGFASNMPIGDQAGCAFLPPAAGQGRDESVLDALARLKIRQERSFLSCLDEMTYVRDCDILILSTYDNDELREKMRMLMGRNRSVKLHLLPAKAVNGHAA